MKNTSAEHKHSWLGENRRRCPVLPSLASWGPCLCLPPEAPGREVPEQTSLWGSIFGVHSGPVQQMPLCGRAAPLRSPSGARWLAQARTGCIGTTEETAACGTGWERALGWDCTQLHTRALCPGQLTVTAGQSTYSRTEHKAPGALRAHGHRAKRSPAGLPGTRQPAARYEAVKLCGACSCSWLTRLVCNSQHSRHSLLFLATPLRQCRAWGSFQQPGFLRGPSGARREHALGAAG